MVTKNVVIFDSTSSNLNAIVIHTTCNKDMYSTASYEIIWDTVRILPINGYFLKVDHPAIIDFIDLTPKINIKIRIENFQFKEVEAPQGQQVHAIKARKIIKEEDK